MQLDFGNVKAETMRLRAALTKAQQMNDRTNDEREHFRKALFTSMGERQQMQRDEASMQRERSELNQQLVQHGLTKADVSEMQFRVD